MALLEVICLHENDAKRAAQGGADRIELVGTMDDGGLAPSPELLARVLTAVDIPVRPMLRLDGGFRADPGRRDEILRLASIYRDLGADGPVLGFLDEATGVDVDTVIELTDDFPRWTFHRAIDSSLEPDKAWVQLLGLPGLDQVLTAGSPRGVEHGIDDLIERANADPRVAALIMAGGGLRAEHVPWLYQAGVRAFHIGSPARPQGSWKAWVDADLVRSWRELLDRLTR
ncbi:copper homeostasis protein CutC [Cutibacterium sp. WCA-380-WT-3A]|uniref:Copper homeostasis protein cutC homolog n=1 Tax=Cutibacterium porci TaxID=2605781 RepID=A0A7K0J5E7_9ACTN|nr:copper homeostasis protein CutC [Cutibacterium porci]MSS45132.1 copper homeostasis protein CutC [Cutibacterium porci]